MTPPKKTGLARIIAAFGYSLNGLRSTWKTEAAFRQESILAIFMLPAALWLGNSATQKSLLILVVMLVLVVELLNSAVEAAIDRIGPEHHPLSAHAKDAGSAAVFMSLCLVGIVWLLVIVERFVLTQ